MATNVNKKLRKDCTDLLPIFLNDVPLMDVRAPVEFDEGAFPQSHNIPILDDEQRRTIGIRYKQAGQEEAINLGLKLATKDIYQDRISLWQAFCEQNPEGYLYCFRGGLRSRTSQQWLQQVGVHYPLIEGGYKQMRRFLINQFDLNVNKTPLLLIAGATGSGKTDLLTKIPASIDLEKLAQHRGSAFGRLLGSQPSQIDWENRVSIELIKHCHEHSQVKTLVLEDEGRLIGRISLPQNLQLKMKQSNLIVLKSDLDDRVKLIRKDYIDMPWLNYKDHYGEQAEQEFSLFVLDNLTRIKKRLGGLLYKQIEQIFTQALDHLFSTNKGEKFEPGIQSLLNEYYDPMYKYMLEKRQGRILFSGYESDLLEWLSNNMEQAK